MARYGRNYRREYGAEHGPGAGAWAGVPAPGIWGWMGAPTGLGYPFGYGNWAAPYDYLGMGGAGYDREGRRRPEQSGAYGRGGDQELRRWARERGYDTGYTIQPNFRDRPIRPQLQGGYDRGYRQRGYDPEYRRGR